MVMVRSGVGSRSRRRGWRHSVFGDGLGDEVGVDRSEGGGHGGQDLQASTQRQSTATPTRVREGKGKSAAVRRNPPFVESKSSKSRPFRECVGKEGFGGSGVRLMRQPTSHLPVRLRMVRRHRQGGGAMRRRGEWAGSG